MLEEAPTPLGPAAARSPLLYGELEVLQVEREVVLAVEMPMLRRRMLKSSLYVSADLCAGVRVSELQIFTLLLSVCQREKYSITALLA